VSEAITGSGIRAYLEQFSGVRSLGTATWTGSGYTVEWDDGFKDPEDMVWHFGRDSFSLQLVEGDEDDDNDYPERCEICAYDEKEGQEQAEHMDTQDLADGVAAEALNAVLYTLAEGLGLVKRGDSVDANIVEILSLALSYIALGQEAERNG
jgi:hypothetical protein